MKANYITLGTHKITIREFLSSIQKLNEKMTDMLSEFFEEYDYLLTKNGENYTRLVKI